MPNHGAFVLSLDFELHWGVRDHRRPDEEYRRKALASLQAVPRLLDLFEEFGISATWATVGFLFAHSRREIEECSPVFRPRYRNPALNPYEEALAEGEADDPLHYAPSVISAIRSRPGQEIASHTFSHYFCLEAGNDREAFAADMQAAAAIAARRGIALRSLVFPRNQTNPAYLDALPALGIFAYRGTAGAWMYRPAPKALQQKPARRAARLLDAYFPMGGDTLQRWDDLVDERGMWNIRAGAYLRPYSPPLSALEPVRLHRIVGMIDSAATSNRIFHLWFHPLDLGAFASENLRFLRSVFERVAYWKRRAGFRALNMQEVVEAQRKGATPGAAGNPQTTRPAD